MTRPEEEEKEEEKGEEEEEEERKDIYANKYASLTHRVAVFPFWRSRKTATWAPRRHKYCHCAQSLRRREPSCRPSCTACPLYSGIQTRAKT